MKLKISCLSHLEPIDQYILSSLHEMETLFVKPQRDPKIIWDAYSLMAQQYILRGLKFNKMTVNPRADYEEAISSSNPDLFVTCDAPIVSSDFLARLTVPAINIHFGISRKYRGTHTVFWPLLKGDYDHIGLTIHLIDNNIDTGTVLLEYYPALEKGDTEMSIWRKLAVAAHCLLPQVCHELSDHKNVIPSSSAEKGDLYLSRQRTFFKEIKLRYMEWTGKLNISAKDERTVWYI